MTVKQFEQWLQFCRNHADPDTDVDGMEIKIETFDGDLDVASVEIEDDHILVETR